IQVFGIDNFKLYFSKRLFAESVTRTCSARVTNVLRALHERVPPVTRTCNGFYAEELSADDKTFNKKWTHIRGLYAKIYKQRTV
uniref:hypothetical protein n=1 Tax=Bacteroides sp. TaxID=29523 RepID=UPI0025B9BB18